MRGNHRQPYLVAKGYRNERTDAPGVRRVAIYLTDGLFEAVHQIAIEEEMAVSAVARRLIRVGLRNRSVEARQ